MITRLKAVFEYDGTDFFGWQIQKSRRTVQGEIEKALHQRFNKRIIVIGAGRTDTGVHALGQTAHFDCPLDEIRTNGDPAAELFKNIRAMLPPDITLKALERAPAGFHARFSAVKRRYRYDIATELSALKRLYCWQVQNLLTVQRMKNALTPLIGEQSFEPLAKLNPKEKHYRCRIEEAVIIKRGNLISFYISADRFLHGMVRAIVGTLVDVGRGWKEPDIFVRILKTNDRSLVSGLAPARGLFLEAVEY